MSDVFYIKGGEDRWFPAVQGLIAKGAEWEAMYLFSEGEEAEPSNIDAGHDVQCFVANSIRGVGISPEEGGGHSVRISLLGSAADYAFAYRVMWEALNAGAAVEHESGEVLTLEQIAGETAANLQQEQWAFGVNSLRQAVARSDGGVVHMPVVGRQLPVTAADLELPDKQLESLFADRSSRYLHAFPASVMTLQHESGAQINLSNFPQFETLISKSVQAISFQGENGMLIEPWVPASVFFNAIGNRLEDAGDCWYVPAIDFNAEAALLNSLRASAGNFDPAPAANAGTPVGAQMQVDAVGSGPGAQGGAPPAPGGGGIDDFTTEDWDLLRRSPVIVLMLVAGADGNVDKKELKAFAGILGGATNLPPGTQVPPGMDTLIAGFNLTAAHLEATVTEVVNNPGGAVAHLADLTRIGQLFDSKLPPEAAMGAKMGLFGLGKSVAEASGGFLGIGSKISKQEKTALGVIAATLGLAGG